MDAPTMTLDDVKAAIAAKAADDAAFRAALLADPKAAVAQALSTDLPAHVTIQVVEEAPDSYVVVLPAVQAADGELSDADLEGVSGGAAKAGAAGAQKAASIFFGVGISGATHVISQIASSAKDPNAGKIKDAAGKIITCGA